MAGFARTLVLLCGILISTGVGAALCGILAEKNRPSRLTTYVDDHVTVKLVNGVYTPNTGELIKKRDWEHRQAMGQAAAFGGIGGAVVGFFVFKGLGNLLIRSDRASKA
jgi:hypothetical protein